MRLILAILMAVWGLEVDNASKSMTKKSLCSKTIAVEQVTYPIGKTSLYCQISLARDGGYFQTIIN